MLTSRIRSTLLVAVVVLSVPLSEAQAASHAIHVPWRTGMALGRGFDTAKASVDDLGFALTPESATVRPPVCPFERKFDLELIDNLSEYKEKVGIEAEAEINVVVASATGKLAFARNSVKNNRSIYLMLRDERVNCHYRLDNPELTDDAEDLLVSNPGAFRQLYGDRFLSTVSTGGSFHAVMEIKTTDETEREELAFKLKAKVFGVTVFSWGVQEVFEDIVDEHDASIRVHVNNSEFELGESTESLWQRYADYLQEVAGPVCNGTSPNGHGECNFRSASFEDYRQLTRQPVGDGGQLRRVLLDSLARRHKGYADILRRAEQVQANLSDYEYADEGTTAEARVASLVADARAQTDTVRNAYDSCLASPTSCQAPETLTLVPETSLEGRFPVLRARYPQDCQALRRQHGVRRDGHMRIYHLGRREHPLDVYCAHMASDPTTLLLLPSTSASTARPDRNFARRVGAPPAPFEVAPAITSVRTGLAVELSGGRATVLPQQTALVSHLGGPLEEEHGQVHEQAHLLTVRSCAAGRLQHLANLMLHGTPWRVAEDTELASQVPTGSEGRWQLSDDRKQLDAYADARTGCVDLFIQGPLELEYAP